MMESPPSTSAWSDAFILSDDSGLLLTSGSISSGSMSGESRTGYGQLPLEFQDSDCEDKSFSQTDSLDGMSDIMCGEHFNTLKKGPHWSESTKTASPIEPPLEFQDIPNIYDNIAEQLAKSVITAVTHTLQPPRHHPLSNHATVDITPAPYRNSHSTSLYSDDYVQPYAVSLGPPPQQQQQPPPVAPTASPAVPTPHPRPGLHPVLAPHPTYWSPDYLPVVSPCHHGGGGGGGGGAVAGCSGGGGGVGQYYSYGHHGRPSSRSSLGSSRLSSSHNSLAVLPAGHQPDDSSFITQAVSHDTLTSGGSGSGSHAHLYTHHQSSKRDGQRQSRQRQYRYYDEPIDHRRHHRATSSAISDLYTVPFDSDVYAVPVDTVTTTTTTTTTIGGAPAPLSRRSVGAASTGAGAGCSTPVAGGQLVAPKRRRRNTTTLTSCRELDKQHGGGGGVGKGGKKGTTCRIDTVTTTCPPTTVTSPTTTTTTTTNDKRHSVAGPSHATVNTATPTAGTACSEPIHMSLQEVRQYLQKFCSASGSSSTDSGSVGDGRCVREQLLCTNNNKYPVENGQSAGAGVMCDKEMDNGQKMKRNTFLINIKNKKVKDSCENITKTSSIGSTILSCKSEKRKKNNSSSIPRFYSFKQILCNMFRFRRIFSPEREEKVVSNGSIIDTNENGLSRKEDDYNNVYESTEEKNRINRALPPLPTEQEPEQPENDDEEHSIDFATSFRKVKDYGWYWGPLSSEGAEKILSNEPHGSFIVRDSSDDHYIFSLTFKLNNSVRHVRIDHDQGNFSFGSCTRFKSQTIVEFIQNAVEHSRSGRYLFFLHRRPVIGPVRVQLLHPVSRFKQTESLQHICRFVILKHVRKDLVSGLPLPRRIIDYLHAPQYYISERLLDVVANGAGVADAPGGGNTGPTVIVTGVLQQQQQLPGGGEHLDVGGAGGGGGGGGRDSSAESSSNDAEVREVLARQVALQDNYVFEPRALGGAQAAVASAAAAAAT